MSVFGVILVRISPYSDWIRRDTPYHSAYAGKYKCGKIRTRITPNKDTFHVAYVIRTQYKMHKHSLTTNMLYIFKKIHVVGSCYILWKIVFMLISSYWTYNFKSLTRSLRGNNLLQAIVLPDSPFTYYRYINWTYCTHQIKILETLEN